MRRALMVSTIVVVAQIASGAALAQNAATTPALDGKTLFHDRCAMCHGAGGMGTGLLVRRVQPAELEKRKNLNADYVFQFARRGLGNMPPVTPGEVNNAELRAIADYLAPKAQAPR